jgi:hypothetical protein
MVMVRLNQQNHPKALYRYARFRKYVPRFFILDATGKVDENITSGHPRYPYFYSVKQIGKLKAAMKKAIEG